MLKQWEHSNRHIAISYKFYHCIVNIDISVCTTIINMKSYKNISDTNLVPIYIFTCTFG